MAGNVQAPTQKYSSLRKSEHRRITLPSRPHEGRFAIVTIRGAGCDGRISPQDVRYDAYGQAAWSCPPDAGVKPRVISPGRRRLSSPVLRGERGVSRKTMAQGVPERFRRTCVGLRASFSFARVA